MHTRALARSVLAVGVLSLGAASASANPITIPITGTTGLTAVQMVANLVPVAAISGINVIPGSELYVGAPRAVGLFDGGDAATGLPFASGVVLTSGCASGVPGPNLVGNYSCQNTSGGDADLDALTPPLTPGGPSHADAATLTFKFKTTANAISFQYVFGSEEYPEFATTQFNDVFGAFLDGTNIALLPGTSTPITINTVNGTLNSTYFTANPDGAAAPYNIQYDGLVGFSLPLFGTRTFAVDPSFEHTIKFGVEDVGRAFGGVPDRNRDSGVFLAANSFGAAPPPTTAVPEPTTLVTLGSVLLALGRLWRRRKAARGIVT